MRLQIDKLLQREIRPAACFPLVKKGHNATKILLFLLLLLGWDTCLMAMPEKECVVLLHGSGRTMLSMKRMEARLEAAGYEVVNFGYADKKERIEQIAEAALPAAVAECRGQGAETIHFVTHSMGGILVRYYLKHHAMPQLGRVVMLAPPHRGSELVDKLGDTRLFRLLTGPAAGQLGTGAASLPLKLGRVEFETGIIAGDRSLNPYYSSLIAGPDDGKVSVDRTKVEGMSDWLVVHATHTFIMWKSEVIDQTIHFLRYGRFKTGREP